MALSVPKAPGVAQMLKDGARVSKIYRFTFKNLPILLKMIEIWAKIGCCVRCMLPMFVELT